MVSMIFITFPLASCTHIVLRINFIVGTISYSLANLSGLDIPYDIRAYSEKDQLKKQLRDKPMHSAITWICKNDSHSALKIPEIKDIIEQKWNSVGKKEFVKRYSLDLSFAIVITVRSFLVNTGATLYPKNPEEVAILVLDPILLILFALFFFS